MYVVLKRRWVSWQLGRWANMIAPRYFSEYPFYGAYFQNLDAFKQRKIVFSLITFPNKKYTRFNRRSILIFIQQFCYVSLTFMDPFLREQLSFRTHFNISSRIRNRSFFVAPHFSASKYLRAHDC